jgi:methylated-DNA-[protein]-cysteine S-methyltransferase
MTHYTRVDSYPTVDNPAVYTTVDSPVGELLIVGSRDELSGQLALTGLYMSGQRYEPLPAVDWVRDGRLFAGAVEQLFAYFAGESKDFDIPLAPRGSGFQRSVWSALSQIGFGSTRTYGEVADTVADRTKTRAVAAAIGRNPIGIVVPCHRVLGADGTLTGYAGGLARKRWLLDHEASVSGSVLPV